MVRPTSTPKRTTPVKVSQQENAELERRIESKVTAALTARFDQMLSEIQQKSTFNEQALKSEIHQAETIVLQRNSEIESAQHANCELSSALHFAQSEKFNLENVVQNLRSAESAASTQQHNMQIDNDSEVKDIRFELQETVIRAEARESHFKQTESVAEQRHAEAVGLLRRQLNDAIGSASATTRPSEVQPCSACPVKDAQIQ